MDTHHPHSSPPSWPAPGKGPDDESTLRALLENASHIAVYRVETDLQDPYLGKIVMVSPSAGEILGIRDPYNFAGWFEHLHPDDRQRVVEASQRAATQGTPYNETARFFHPLKEKWVWVHTISNPHFGPNGAVEYFDGMVIDITDQMVLREAEMRSKAAEGLREIIEVINSNRPLQEILDFIARQACRLLQATATMIRHVDEERNMVITVTGYALPPEFTPLNEMPFYRTQHDEMLMRREPYFIADVAAEYSPWLNMPEPVPYARMQKWQMEAEIKYYRSVLKAPVFIKDTLYGALTFYYDQPRVFGEEDIRMAMTVADQAALAIENARLIAQVKETAVVEERSRLARELHDAVTQTLFSTTLISDVLPVLWERNPVEARRRLEELRQLNRGALAEMRTLLLELRPAALADSDLCDLLRHLSNAFTGRARVPVDLATQGKCEIPLDVKVALYRITQEALNNIAKHAEAETVTIRLLNEEGRVELSIRDDGLGFQMEQAGSDHLGLGIMRERAAQVGAQFELDSRPGAGTRVHVTWVRGSEPGDTEPGEEQ